MCKVDAILDYIPTMSLGSGTFCFFFFFFFLFCFVLFWGFFVCLFVCFCFVFCCCFFTYSALLNCFCKPPILLLEPPYLAQNFGQKYSIACHRVKFSGCCVEAYFYILFQRVVMQCITYHVNAILQVYNIQYMWSGVMTHGMELLESLESWTFLITLFCPILLSML